MNWQQYTSLLSTTPTLPSSRVLLNQQVSQRHGYVPEFKNFPATAATTLYPGAYLPYLTSRAKEFRPTVLTRQPVLKPTKQELLSPISSPPKSCSTEGNARMSPCSSTGILFIWEKKHKTFDKKSYFGDVIIPNDSSINKSNKFIHSNHMNT